MKTAGLPQSSNVADYRSPATTPWHQQIAPGDFTNLGPNPFGGGDLMQENETLRGIAWHFREGLPTFLGNLLSNPFPVQPQNIPGMANPAGIPQKLQAQPYGGMGFKGELAAEMSRQMDKTGNGLFSGPGMGQDRTRPWAENSTAGWEFMLPGGGSVKGSPLAPPSDLDARKGGNGGRKPDGDLWNWKGTVGVEPFNPEWIKPGRTNPQPSGIGDLLRGLFMGG